MKNFMIDIMSPLINEADNFTTDILDLILINIVEPKKSQNKYAYQLAEQLIVKTADSLETIIKMVSRELTTPQKLYTNLKKKRFLFLYFEGYIPNSLGNYQRYELEDNIQSHFLIFLLTVPILCVILFSTVFQSSTRSRQS